ncbi:T9SS type A sorting domain-containing protein [Fluviicola taffensis]|uniref:T9SS type A sorting domain-containing protein n=1 Tax=Fluviicola taffensis TaxID=191579 RepID=UPI003138166E
MRSILLAILGAILFSLIAPTTSLGQSTNPNMHGWHAKYWFYRWRLRNDFMVMGEGPGQSLVAESRNLNRGQFMKWADATIMHGYYLTMLAIEHKILEDKGRTEDLKNNERELYYAIKAFERLDYVSETFYSSEPGFDEPFRVGDATLPPDVNGYFFRDDVPPTFLNTNQFPSVTPNFTPNYYSLTNQKTGIDYGQMNYSQSDYSGLWGITNPGDGNSAPDLNVPQHPIVNYEAGTQPTDNGEDSPYGFGEASQDQIIRLLLGFFAIVKSIPDVTYQVDLDNNGTMDVFMNFNQEAKRHSTNMIGRLAGQFSGTLNVPLNSNWPILYPSLGIPGMPSWSVINPREKTADIGDFLFQYMIPMQLVADPLFTTDNNIGLGSSSYATVLSYNPAAQLAWNLGINGYDDVGNVKMALILNVISNSGSGLIPVPRFVANKSADMDIDGLYVPLYDYFWDWNPTDNENDVERKQHAYNYANLMLEAAPCVGPHNFGYTNIHKPDHSQAEGPYSAVQDPDGIPYYWNVPFVFDVDHDRWDDGKVDIVEAQEYGPPQTTGYKIDEGWFSGMDYMLLYNLIYANNEGDKPLYHDLINRVVDYDINTDDYTDMMVYTGEGLMIGAFENLKVSGNIYGNTPVTLKALDYVQLDAGIYDPNNLPDGITVEVGKITCGNDFTSSNTPYSIDQCQTCGLENQVGSFVSPIASGKDRSLPMKMPTMSEFEERAKLSQTATIENEVTVFPNPTSDFLQITADGELQQIVVLDQNGAELKQFVPSNNLYDIRELASGIYTIILTFNNNETKHIKVVKL